MYRLFNDASPINVGQKMHPRFNYENTITQRNIDRLIDHRRTTTSFVSSDHFLVKLLDTINVRYENNDFAFFERVRRRAFDICESFGITSYAHRGKVRSGTFFNPKTFEVIVMNDADMPPDMKTSWMDKQPIRILSSPRSDLSIETLDGSGKEPETGTAVILLDVALLCLQFEYWKKSENINDNIRSRGAEHFLMRHPLTNLVRSHLDVALINRLHRIALGYPTSSYQAKVPFTLTNNSNSIDQTLFSVIERLQNKDMTFEDMLRNIPTFNSEDALQTVRVNKVPYTQQVIWTLVASRIDVVSMLLALSAKTESAMNVSAITEIRRDIIRMESGKLLSNGLPAQMAADLKERINLQIMPFL